MRKGLDFRQRMLKLLPEKLPALISALLIVAACIVYYVSYGTDRDSSVSYYEVSRTGQEQISDGTENGAETVLSAELGTGQGTDGTAAGKNDAETSVRDDAGTGTDSASGGLININSADSALLVTLNGIGQTRAAAIISYRERNGPYHSIEEIMNVPGIKEGIFNKIKNQICTE